MRAGNELPLKPIWAGHQEEEPMAEFTVEITGENRDQLAQDLKSQLTEQHGTVQVFTETERALDPIAILSVVLSGVQAADILWKWWQSRRGSASTVTIRTAGGRTVQLSTIDQLQLEIILGEDE
jgi:hypothetical protein